MVGRSFLLAALASDMAGFYELLELRTYSCSGSESDVDVDTDVDVEEREEKEEWF